MRILKLAGIALALLSAASTAALYATGKILDSKTGVLLEHIQNQIPGLQLKLVPDPPSLLSRSGRLFYTYTSKQAKNAAPWSPLQGALDYHYSLTLGGVNGDFTHAQDSGNQDQLTAHYFLNPVNFKGDFEISPYTLSLDARVHIDPLLLKSPEYQCKSAPALLELNAGFSRKLESTFSTKELNCSTVPGARLELKTLRISTAPELKKLPELSEVKLSCKSLQLDEAPPPPPAPAKEQNAPQAPTPTSATAEAAALVMPSSAQGPAANTAITAAQSASSTPTGAVAPAESTSEEAVPQPAGTSASGAPATPKPAAPLQTAATAPAGTAPQGAEAPAENPQPAVPPPLPSSYYLTDADYTVGIREPDSSGFGELYANGSTGSFLHSFADGKSLPEYRNLRYDLCLNKISPDRLGELLRQYGNTLTLDKLQPALSKEVKIDVKMLHLELDSDKLDATGSIEHHPGQKKPQNFNTKLEIYAGANFLKAFFAQTQQLSEKQFQSIMNWLVNKQAVSYSSGMYQTSLEIKDGNLTLNGKSLGK